MNNSPASRREWLNAQTGAGSTRAKAQERAGEKTTMTMNLDDHDNQRGKEAAR